MKSMTIGKKLYFSFGAALALTLILGAVSLMSVRSLGSSMSSVVEVNAAKRYLATTIRTFLSDFAAADRGIVARTYGKDKATVNQYNSDFRETAAAFSKSIEELASLTESAEEKQAVQQLRDDAAKISQYHDELFRLADAGDAGGAFAVLSDKVKPLTVRSQAAAQKFALDENNQMKAASESAQSLVARCGWISILLIVLSLVVGVVVLVIVRQINTSLRQTVSELSEGAEQTASAASQVSSASQALAQGSSEQAASLEETSASSEEINSMTRKNSENSRDAADLVSQSQQTYNQTNQSLDQMVIAMEEIKTSSDKISKIIKTIDEIAFQTNILALNAAVEAARAGEAGMGFAVVADEVRNLAQRCAQAAKDTAALIEESIVKSNDGKIKVDQVAIAIRSITEESVKVKTLVDEVNLGSQEQARGIEQIGKAIVQMEQVTQKTAANAEECAAAAEELNAQSETLRDVVERLSTLVGGGETANGRHAGTRHKRTEPARAAALRHLEPGTGLTALNAAVGHKSNGHSAELLPVSRRSAQHGIPLEESFKEF